MRSLVILVLLGAGAARAEAPAAPAPSTSIEIKNTFAFDWLNPHRSKCTKVAGALLKKLTRTYACEVHDGESASRVPVVAVCTAKQSSVTSAYMLFTKLADCKLERDTQLSNGI